MSTPISDLRTGEAETPTETTMQILREMKSRESDPGQPDEDDLERPLKDDAEFQYYDDTNRYEDGSVPMMQVDQKLPIVQGKSNTPSVMSMALKVFNEMKQPLLILCLYMVFGLSTVDKILMKYIPRITSSVGNLNYFGTLLKGVALTIVFYVGNKFLK